jgi:hypothetical protein
MFNNFCTASPNIREFQADAPLLLLFLLESFPKRPRR